MKFGRLSMQFVSSVLVVCLIIPYTGTAQTESGTAGQFSRGQLAQMLAPIALYPDSLLSQILMASTYPLDIVEADRWVRANPNLRGSALDDALMDMTWDVSVKSLCHYPAVLAEMSKNLDRTSKLGDAFLGQQDEVMDAVQELRRKANAQGNLRYSDKERIVYDGDTIIIEPASPDIVYVPAYDPNLIYGPWWYPAYPPYLWSYPWYPFGGIIAFGSGFFVGIAVASWSWCNWHTHHVHVNFNKTAAFNRMGGSVVVSPGQTWRHDPVHRRGVAYRNPATSQRFGQPLPRAGEPRRDIRGFERPPFSEPRRDVERIAPGTTTRPAPVPQRNMGGQGVDVRPPAPGGAPVQPAFQGGRRDTIFNNVGNGSRERMAGERGRESRESFRGAAAPAAPRSGGIQRGGRGDLQRGGGRR
ncbi:MAG TPA: DUF3300 domain-containing protein [Dissulfurispiraceae bacterium]|nr:DUF3300 domain-containing protein [Dissulfurispiraceae bacterium]